MDKDVLIIYLVFFILGLIALFAAGFAIGEFMHRGVLSLEKYQTKVVYVPANVCLEPTPPIMINCTIAECPNYNIDNLTFFNNTPKALNITVVMVTPTLWDDSRKQPQGFPNEYMPCCNETKVCEFPWWCE